MRADMVVSEPIPNNIKVDLVNVGICADVQTMATRELNMINVHQTSCVRERL